MYKFILVGLGGMIGALLRYVALLYIPIEQYNKILLINILGCFLLSFISQTFTHHYYINLFFIVGIFTSFTMLWSFLVHVSDLWNLQNYLGSILYLSAMNVGCIIAIVMGRYLATLSSL